MFKEDFVWGVASSAYQTEGTDPDDDRGKNVWDTFTETGKISNKRDAYEACDMMHRYKDDFKLMKNLGIKAYRFSLNWARILPEGTGKVNEKAIELYRDMINEMRANGIVPYCTLFHWEYPQALQDKGGWLNPESPDWFAEYAKVVAENFSDICEYFITLNEPECFVGLGHGRGIHAPGLELPTKDVFQVAHNALLAHGKAVIALRKYAKRDIKVGYAPTCGVAYPYTNSPEDIEAARKVYFGFYQPLFNWTWNVSWFCDPVFLGKYPEEGVNKFKEFLPEYSEEDMKLISQPLDFMGQNIYNGYFVKAGENGEPQLVDRPNGFPLTASKWPFTPQCLYWGVRFIYERYHMPIYITENGMSGADFISSDGQVHDTDRIEFLDAYISELQRAVDDGADVRGYFLWTFLDNFEWDKEYSEKFGIVYVDFTSQRRVVKDSALWYQKTIERNGRNLMINNVKKNVLFIEPQLKERVWGGNKLVTEYGYESELTDCIGECWGVSAYPDTDCKVAGGYYDGRTLSDLWENVPELFGNPGLKEFPLLTKIIDAKSDLSIQVHPDNEYAKVNENSLGKKECWYIVDCPEDACLVLGNGAGSREELIKMIDDENWSELCREVKVKKGDFVQIDPGTLHAIKGGFVILESQQSSDVTYRVYDYDRMVDGKKRELHLKQSIDVIKTPDVYDENRIIHTSDEINKMTLLEANDCYKVWKLNVDGRMNMSHDEKFLICSVIEGDGIVNGRPVKKGSHFIIPCGMEDVYAQGKMTLIMSAM